jgi:hypothetical protein
VRVHDRRDLAARAVDLFGQGVGGGRLVIVSCTDWNGSSYDKTVVVVAEPLGEPRPAGSGTEQAAAG